MKEINDKTFNQIHITNIIIKNFIIGEICFLKTSNYENECEYEYIELEHIEQQCAILFVWC